jgi:hypothetical protein
MNKEADYTRSKRSSEFGKYGILNLSSLFTRNLEFQAWFTEIKKKNPHDLTKENQKKFFEEFIQKYNNAELPSKKYYDIIKYQSKIFNKLLRKRKRMRDKMLKSADYKLYQVEEDGFVFDDEGKKEKERKFIKELEQKRRLEEAIYTMNKEKAEAIKEIDYKSNLMRHLYQTGDISAALDIHKQYFDVKKDKDKQEPGLKDEFEDEDGR